MDIKEKLESNIITLAFSRRLTDADLLDWDYSYVTGVSFQWYFANLQGNKEDVFMEPKFINENQNFISWIDLVHFVEAETNMSLTQLQKIVRKEKIHWIERNPNLQKVKSEFCVGKGMLSQNIQNESIERIKAELGLPMNISIKPVTEKTLKQKTLRLGFNLFVFIADVLP